MPNPAKALVHFSSASSRALMAGSSANSPPLKAEISRLPLAPLSMAVNRSRKFSQAGFLARLYMRMSVRVASSRFSGQQLAVLAEGDEDDAVEQFLGDADRLVEVLALLAMQVLDQFQPPPLVVRVQFVADAFLAIGRLAQQFQGPRLLAGPRREQPAALEEAVELVEARAVPQFLEVEFLVGQRALFAVVQADRAKIGDDSPRARRAGR